MLLQNLIVAVLVLASALYAVWSLLPAGAKRALALRAQSWPLPAWALRRLQAVAGATGGCGGCGGCAGASPSKPASAPQTVTFYRRRS
jgi:uncharacterized membrane protein YfcA